MAPLRFGKPQVHLNSVQPGGCLTGIHHTMLLAHSPQCRRSQHTRSVVRAICSALMRLHDAPHLPQRALVARPSPPPSHQAGPKFMYHHLNHYCLYQCQDHQAVRPAVPAGPKFMHHCLHHCLDHRLDHRLYHCQHHGTASGITHSTHLHTRPPAYTCALLR